MVAVELEVLAKKFDRFGWERDRGSVAHDRQVTDWMDALQDYPLDEIQRACKTAVLRNPSKMPNEGHIVGEIISARKAAVAHLPKPPEPERKPLDEGERMERMATLGDTIKHIQSKMEGGA